MHRDAAAADAAGTDAAGGQAAGSGPAGGEAVGAGPTGVEAAAAFDVCHPGLALRAVLLVQAALAIAALAGAGSAADWAARQAASAFAGVAATLAWLLAVCALRRPLSRAPAPWRAVAATALGVAAALAAWAPLWWAGLATAAGGLRAAGVAAAGGALAALAWSGLERRARGRRPADAAARLAELQSRIRPHFLFNALNSALALVRADPERAEAVLEDLAQLFRAALAEPGVSVPLADEIELARRYLAIEQVRFGDRLQVRWEVADDARVGAARVPPLVLQPLVENAVRHGIERLPAGGAVVVSAGVRHGQVVVDVANSVGDAPTVPGHGIALDSVRERLRLLHDVAARVELRRDPPGGGAGTFHARIVLPAL